MIIDVMRRRHSGSPHSTREGDRTMVNIDKAVDKAYETKSIKDILAAPPSALAGLTEKHDEVLASLGVKTVEQLGSWKYAEVARSLVALAKHEA
jgi:predicted flap endonuclease-1-like 5' DNA nuclease